MKYQQFVMLVFIIFFSFHISPLAPDSEDTFVYKNDFFGIQLLATDPWIIGSTVDTAPEIFKKAFVEKADPNASPLFLGQMGAAPVFVRFLVEKSDMDMEDYFRLFEVVAQQEKLSFKSLKYAKDKNVMEWEYEGNKNGYSFRFLDFVTDSHGHMMRMSFWTLSSLANKYEPDFRNLAHRFMFMNESSELNFPWVGYESSLVGLELTPPADLSENSSRIRNDDQLPGALFYTIPGKNNTVFLMGSIHIGKADFYPFDDYIEESFAKSKNLVVEADIRKLLSPEAREEIQGLIHLDEGKTLADVLPPELYAKVSEILKSYRIPVESYSMLRPWVVALILSGFGASSEGYANEEGVDQHFLNAAGTKKIIELESTLEQLHLFDELNGEEFLRYSVLTYKHSGSRFNRLVKAWKTGDTEGLSSLVFSEFAEGGGTVAELKPILIDNRNKTMSEKIETYLNSDEDFFVVVGAAHLGGEGGIVALLKQKGFAPVQYTGKKSDTVPGDARPSSRSSAETKTLRVSSLLCRTGRSCILQNP